MAKAADRPGVLVVVGTPIGNREDLSPRARRELLDADVLLCEDTRSPARLLGDGVELPPRISCFVANEGARVGTLLEHLRAGERVAYVSEAGMPGWSDPGLLLVRAAIEEGFRVEVVPGPTAMAAAVVLSGVSAGEVRFVGFPPRDGSARKGLLDSLAREHAAVVLYEAGNRVPRLLADLAEALPDAGTRAAAVCRELTKLHEEVLRGTIAELSARTVEPLRGEVTIVLAGANGSDDDDGGHTAARAVLDAMLDPELKPRDKAKRLADLTGLDARELYAKLARSR